MLQIEKKVLEIEKCDVKQTLYDYYIAREKSISDTCNVKIEIMQIKFKENLELIVSQLESKNKSIESDVIRELAEYRANSQYWRKAELLETDVEV